MLPLPGALFACKQMLIQAMQHMRIRWDRDCIFSTEFHNRAAIWIFYSIDNLSETESESNTQESKTTVCMHINQRNTLHVECMKYACSTARIDNHVPHSQQQRILRGQGLHTLDCLASQRRRAGA